MRRPTYAGSFSELCGSTTSIRDGRFTRNPDFQVRDVGASSPDVSFSQNACSSCSRQPVIVTDATFSAGADVIGSVETGLGAGSGGGVSRRVGSTPAVAVSAAAVFTSGVAGVASAFLRLFAWLLSLDWRLAEGDCLLASVGGLTAACSLTADAELSTAALRDGTSAIAPTKTTIHAVAATIGPVPIARRSDAAPFARDDVLVRLEFERLTVLAPAFVFFAFFSRTVSSSKEVAWRFRPRVQTSPS
jgi:hypothetical protein